MATFVWGELIGSGGFGIVKEAEYIEYEVDGYEGLMAVKFLKDELVDNEEAVNRFVREVRLLDTLGHQNVVPVLGRNLSKRPPWFVMPRAESNLREELEAGAGDDADWCLSTFRCILDGMAHAHEGGVIHRDLKPRNILFINGVPVISDFGLGKQVDPTMTTELTLSSDQMGTMAYMAPEQYDDAKRVTEGADVYALGKILWELLSGRQPRALRRPDLEAVPERFRPFISRCCEDAPEDRYPNAAEALAAFDVITSAVATSVVDPPYERAEKFIHEWSETPVGPDLAVLKQLDAHFHEYEEEERMYFELVPRLPPDLVEQYLGDLSDEFAAMLAIYDGHISGALPFSYCDVVANFYSFVFARTKDPRVQRLVIARLIEMGASHNRFHVGEVLGQVLASIDDAGTAQLAAETIRADAYHARWFDGYIKDKPMLRPIAEAFTDIRSEDEEASEADLPF